MLAPVIWTAWHAPVSTCTFLPGNAVGRTVGLDIAAEELRLAGNALGEIVGETTPDNLLGMIFSKFCIGK